MRAVHISDTHNMHRFADESAGRGCDRAFRGLHDDGDRGGGVGLYGMVLQSAVQA